MVKSSKNRKGVALFMVLATIFMVLILANIILNIAFTQSRHTRHRLSRIQAYYAAQAGMNYALEQLRSGNWTAPHNDTLQDLSFPGTIVNRTIAISVGSMITTGGAFNNTCPINITANYTYNP